MSMLSSSFQKKKKEPYIDKVTKQAQSAQNRAKVSSTENTSTGLSSTSNTSDPGFVRQNTTSITQPGSTALGNSRVGTPMLASAGFNPSVGEGSNHMGYSLRRLGEINRMGEIANQGAQQSYQKRQEAERARMAAMGSGNPFDGFNVNDSAFGYGGQGGITGNGRESLMGLGLNEEQIRNAQTILTIGQGRGFSGDDIQTALMTALAESNLINVNHGDRDSLGLFQQRPSQGWGTAEQVSDRIYSTNKFYDALKGSKRGPNLWNTAQNVQRSAFSDGSNYKAKAQLAQQIYTAYTTRGATGHKAEVAGWANQNVWKYHDFDGAYGSQCVDLFRYYHRDIVGDAQIGSVGSAKNIWTSNEMNRAYNRVGRNSPSQMGDVVVMDGSWGSGHGHVAIILKDLGDRVQMINSNSSTVGNGKPTNIVTVPKRGILGYWRPKKYS